MKDSVVLSRGASSWWLAPVALAAVLFAACAQEPEPPPPPPLTDALRELSSVYKYLDYSKAGPPKRIEDLNQFIDTLPNAYYKLQSGDLVLQYGVSYAAAGPTASQVLAYEKKAPAEGGAVLLRNGEVKELSAAEFAAAKGK